MAIDLEVLRAEVVAEVPWHPARTVAGTLRIQGDNLTVDPRATDGQRVEIAVADISRASLESTLGMLSALRVWHTVRGNELESRFAFSASGERDEQPQGDGGSGLSDRIGPGVARDAAQALESGFRVLSSGLSLGRRTARQAVEGLARHDEYQQWPAAIAQAQERAKKRTPGHGSAHATTANREPIVPAEVQPPAGSAAEQFTWFRDKVPNWLDACSRLARELGVRGVPVIQPMYPLDSGTCRIVVVGEFSRGKSTLINALFGIHGEIALPTGMTPTTSIACALRVPKVGEVDGATISYRTRRPPLELTLDEFRSAVRLADDAEPAAQPDSAPDPHMHEAKRVEVRITGAYLPSGVEIEDTPGLNEHSGRSAGALAALGRADLILFVLAADQLLGDLEREVIAETLLKDYHRNVLFLVNFWDTIEDERERENLRVRAHTILADFPSPFRRLTAAGSAEQRADVFYVSALQAARAQRQRKATPDESGIPLLRARLRELFGPESQAMLLRARAGRARRFVRILRQAVSRTTAERSAGAARPAASRDNAKEAAAAATRVAAGLHDAMFGATARLQVSLEQGTVARLEPVEARLVAAQQAGSSSENDGDLRRALHSGLRAVAADYARAAQDALDLIVARARAAFLERGLPPPAFDMHVAPAGFALPGEAEPAILIQILRNAPRELRDDLNRQASALSSEITRICNDCLHTDRAAAGDADIENASRSDQNAAGGIAELRQLEEDLLRVDHMLGRMI